jgi:hypothetical protein
MIHLSSVLGFSICMKNIEEREREREREREIK